MASYSGLLQERHAPSRPIRLGTHRRSRKGASRPAQPGTSLDTEKQLETSGTAIALTVREWAHEQRTEQDMWREQEMLRRQLNSSVYKLWQDNARAGNFHEAAKWEKQWLQIQNCQTQWAGYKAKCCGDRASAIAVPIGCNHRLCPLCAWRRSQKSRVRIKTMFDRLTHPVMITLTVPNSTSIRKHDFTLFRQRVRKLLAQRKDWIKGGVYSLETTYNRQEKTWHIHAHILCDAATPLPSGRKGVDVAGIRLSEFTVFKRKLEFDWLRLWSKALGKSAAKDASPERRIADILVFHKWLKKGHENRIREKVGGRWRIIDGLSAADIQQRSAWNREFRRVIDIKAVDDRDGAAREVLKYITKVADFSDLPEAIEPFFNAVRGARLIQTFGSWYGVNFDTDFDPEHLDDWSGMECPCGTNAWERIGVFYRQDVVMNEAGRWLLAPHLRHACRGTVPRPTIRALDGPRENEGEQPWSTSRKTEAPEMQVR